jgi:hypothetical protein
MEQLGIFLKGTAKMLVMMMLIIVCINALVVGAPFIKVCGGVSLVAVLYHVYKLFRDTKNN